MKKYLSALVLAVVALSFTVSTVSCSKDNDNTDNSSNEFSGRYGSHSVVFTFTGDTTNLSIDKIGVTVLACNEGGPKGEWLYFNRTIQPDIQGDVWLVNGTLKSEYINRKKIECTVDKCVDVACVAYIYYNAPKGKSVTIKATGYYNGVETGKSNSITLNGNGNTSDDTLNKLYLSADDNIPENIAY